MGCFWDSFYGLRIAWSPIHRRSVFKIPYDRMLSRRPIARVRCRLNQPDFEFVHIISGVRTARALQIHLQGRSISIVFITAFYLHPSVGGYIDRAAEVHIFRLGSRLLDRKLKLLRPWGAFLQMDISGNFIGSPLSRRFVADRLNPGPFQFAVLPSVSRLPVPSYA